MPYSFYRDMKYCQWEKDEEKSMSFLKFYRCKLCNGQVAWGKDELPDRCNARLAFTKINFDDPDDPEWKKHVGRK